MSNTRRETLVAVLRGTNGYSLSELNAMNAIVGDFLPEAESRGLSHTALADRLVAFKTDGGNGLANAIDAIRISFTDVAPATSCEDAVAAAKVALSAAQAALDAVS